MVERLSNRPLLATRADSALFVGRSAELGALTGAVADGLNAILTGDRGSGKTSLLHRLVATSGPRRVVRLDARLATTGATSVLRLVADAIGVEVDANDGDDPVTTLGLIRTIGAAGDLTIALDDLDPATSTALFGRLRDELWEQPTRWIVAVDRDELAAVLRPPADAFFERVVELAPLDAAAARALLAARGLDVDDDVAREITERARGNPRRILATARTIAATPDAAPRLAAGRRFIEDRLASLPSAARMLYDTMVALDRPVSASDRELLDELHWTRPRAVAVLRELEKAGLAESGVERIPERGPGRPRRTFRLVTG